MIVWENWYPSVIFLLYLTLEDFLYNKSYYYEYLTYFSVFFKGQYSGILMNFTAIIKLLTHADFYCMTPPIHNSNNTQSLSYPNIRMSHHNGETFPIWSLDETRCGHNGHDKMQELQQVISPRLSEIILILSMVKPRLQHKVCCWLSLARADNQCIAMHRHTHSLIFSKGNPILHWKKDELLYTL